ncbi:MAG TPA: ATP-dependent DNA helicase RecG [Acidobacteriota bacterium]|nr:ATP-dependent DNA helicase RecG [Acidobacteriota bacterium]HNT16804.1 ATP-dependent DNA helicase RecG [Acidobacteriota bacterium]HPA26929.1 ATP-dependent DNA helicase RecG [Acidobacteriota bacterium]HQO19347.1 ATP-dependent DNA helicase RecG [Acidobacteriota bacterium]HQQ47384.1 ATP-dependent DNA helicase RecG [Acidobacteriota bacterium]
MSPIRSLTPRQAAKLSKAGIDSPRELLYNFPFRYEDRRNLKPVSGVREGEWATLLVTVLDKKGRRSFRSRVSVFEALVTDGASNLHVVWFNQPWLDKTLEKGRKYYLYGKVSLFPTRSGNRLQMENPDIETFSEKEEESIHTNRIVPVYRKIGNFGTKSLRAAMFRVLADDEIVECLPSAILEKEKFPEAGAAFGEIHFPRDDKSAAESAGKTSPAIRRFIFEELFSFETLVLRESAKRKKEKARPIRKSAEIGERLRQALPFDLTSAQKRVFREMADDLSSDMPMYRLLQGDVGSGKSIMAYLGMLWAALSGFQSAYMAPTETLASQVFLGLGGMSEKLGLETVLLLSSTRASEKRRILEGLGSGSIRLVVGTQSLFQEGVGYNNLNFIVIDEQHRFGVRQRAALACKGVNPHMLAMSATPIPRSLALTLHGDLDISVLDEMPPNREKVVTAVRNESARDKVEDFVRRTMDQGKQAIFVFPQIGENEAVDMRAASEAFEKFRLGPFRGYPLAMIHGRMAAKEKDRVMESMRKRETLLLVATTVVEVGIDLPRAGVIVVENAERFGLAQLHQLRGRVGRGREKGYCVLMTGEGRSKASCERLRVLEETSDGFRIAEEDLRLRGAGEIAGTRQWGISQFQFANPARDLSMLEKARKYAEKMLAGELFRNDDERVRFEEWHGEFAKKFQFLSRSG